MTPAEAYSFIHEHGCSHAEVAEYAGLTEPAVRVLMGEPVIITQDTADREFYRWAASKPVLTWHMVAEHLRCGQSVAKARLADFRRKLARVGTKQ
jgi:hypothetical protein